MEECDKIKFEDLEIKQELDASQLNANNKESNLNIDQLDSKDNSEIYFTIEERKAADNLVSLSSLRQYPTIPSLEFIRNFLDCEDCKLYNRALRIQTLIYCCFINDFSYIEGCLTNNLNLQALIEKPFDSTENEVKDINFDKDELEIKDQSAVPNFKTKNRKCKKKIKSNIAPLICHKCQNVFTTKNGMKYHLKYVHTKENENVIKPFKCPFSEICNRKYKNKNGLFYHLQHHHKKDNENLDILVETKNVVNASKAD